MGVGAAWVLFVGARGNRRESGLWVFTQKTYALRARGCTCGCFVAPCFSTFHSVVEFRLKRETPESPKKFEGFPLINW
jgi:hypothetical protein